MMRVVKPVPAPENPPVVVPAPNTNSLAVVVVNAAAARGGAGARSGRGLVECVDGIDAAVLEYAEIDERRCGVDACWVPLPDAAALNATMCRAQPLLF